MSRIRGKDTVPELAVRTALHASGYRYVLHPKYLPGRPDLAFPARRKAIFVHGCFWHGHSCRHGRRRPGTNTEYWEVKYVDNKRRDAKKAAALRALGWKVMTIWECHVKKGDWLSKAEAFLTE